MPRRRPRPRGLAGCHAGAAGPLLGPGATCRRPRGPGARPAPARRSVPRRLRRRRRRRPRAGRVRPSDPHEEGRHEPGGSRRLRRRRPARRHPPPRPRADQPTRPGAAGQDRRGQPRHRGHAGLQPDPRQRRPEGRSAETHRHAGCRRRRTRRARMVRCPGGLVGQLGLHRRDRSRLGVAHPIGHEAHRRRDHAHARRGRRCRVEVRPRRLRPRRLDSPDPRRRVGPPPRRRHEPREEAPRDRRRLW